MSENSPCNVCQHNQNACLCPNDDCENHGKCCDCVVTHRNAGTPPLCMRPEAERR